MTNARRGYDADRPDPTRDVQDWPLSQADRDWPLTREQAVSLVLKWTPGPAVMMALGVPRRAVKDW